MLYHLKKMRILEETYMQFVEWCRYDGSTRLFVSLHSDLENYPIQNLHRIRTDVNYELNDVDNVIKELKGNPLFMSKVIRKDKKNNRMYSC